jgi:Sigma-70, region 4
VVKLAYFGGYSNREIAAVVGLTEGTVQRRLRRALAAISEYIQHGRRIGRRALYALTAWLSGRWVGDALHNAVPAGAVAAATVIILAQPVSSPAVYDQVGPTHSSAPSTTTPVVPPIPSPTAPVAVPSLPPVTVPDVPEGVLPNVQLPVPTPSLPVKVKNLL